ncbi:MAG: hypothetical protein QOF98_981, partial [Streptomyces sp.]|jgi:hypothetical protein|nr:hypothetical protein [Streptomyces sp.]
VAHRPSNPDRDQRPAGKDRLEVTNPLAPARRPSQGQVTVFTSDVDDLEKLVPDTIVVR